MATVIIRCPYDDEPIECELTFEGDPPVFNLDAPKVIEHMRATHGNPWSAHA